MHRISIYKPTGKKIEVQFGGDDVPDLMAMRLETLKQNAINAGYSENDVEVKWITDSELAVVMAPTAEEIAAQEAAEALADAKLQAIADNLPSWNTIDTQITNATSIAALKEIVRKMARIMYLEFKGSVV